MTTPDPAALRAEADRRAEAWLGKVDPNIGVGSKHHTVPGFYLRRFANKTGQLSVRDRDTGALSTRGYLDMRIKDFYTVIGADGALDGRLEQVLSVIETNAARIITDLLSPYLQPPPLDPVDFGALVQFLAFQLERGPRKRRELELMADYEAKVRAGRILTRQNIGSDNVRLHPNVHLEAMCRTTEHLAPYMSSRPLTLVNIDRSLLITGDEPVILNVDPDNVQHQPDCFIDKKELDRRRRQARKTGQRWSQIVHIYFTRPSGVASAREIALPLTPRTVLFLGPTGSYGEPRQRLRGDEATELADTLNEQVIAQSLSWVAANPEHPSLASMEFPPPGPLLGVCDGGSEMSSQLKTPPQPRRPQLLRDWK